MQITFKGGVMIRLFSIRGIFAFLLAVSGFVFAQGVTTAALNGFISDDSGELLVGANVEALHEETGTKYGAATRTNGAYNIPNMRIGGPYQINISYVGYKSITTDDIYLSLGQDLRLDFTLAEDVEVTGTILVTGEQDEVLNATRTGAETYIAPQQVAQLPSIKRSTRDLFRLDPRSDGNFSFGGSNWLYNNISLDGSYFNNPFGLDDPAPGGQTNAEPVPFEAIEQVQISVAPYDVRQGGFTGAGINSVTKSGTNTWKGSVYSYTRNENFIGDEVAGETILNPDLVYYQSGFTIGGPIIKDKLFFFLNAEIERREDPGSNFTASRNGSTGSTVSRVDAATMDAIRQRMIDVYNYDPGVYEDYINETVNDKLLLKLDWNINDEHNASFRWNMLDASRDLPPHPFAISFNNTGRGPNASTLPFKNSGYAINNELNSFALEVNSQMGNMANRFFASYNQFRDFRDPNSGAFPTIEIAEGGITYTTVGHEPFSINNVLDQDVLQFTDNFNYYMDNHVLTAGVTYEQFQFNNSFNLFYHGFFGFNVWENPGDQATTFASLNDFFAATDPNVADSLRVDFNSFLGSGSFANAETDVGQIAVYAQDEMAYNEHVNFTFGLRVDAPVYLFDLESNTFSKQFTYLDEKGNPENIDAGKLPDVQYLFSPRVGFNWDIEGDLSSQLRGGTGIFTGRLPFVWIGNQVANQVPGDLNSTVSDFKWPQLFKTNIAYDRQLPYGILGTAEFIYGKDLNAIYVRNANLANPIGTIGGSDGRPRWDPGNNAVNDLNPFDAFSNGALYVLDNTDEGYNLNATIQLRKRFDNGLMTSVGYNYMEAMNTHSSTEIASFLWQFNAISENPNKPELSYSQFGNRNRFIASATYTQQWSDNWATHFGLFAELAEGPRHSYIYAGDLNGDGVGGNDLLYVPKNEADINLVDIPGGDDAATQWDKLDAFIKQDDYLNDNRGKITDRNGAVGEWFTDIDLRIMQDFKIAMYDKMHTFQLSLDILNLGNLINSDWGVRTIAGSSAKAPLIFTGLNAQNEPELQFTGDAADTFLDDISIESRWQIQLGLKYYFE